MVIASCSYPPPWPETFERWKVEQIFEFQENSANFAEIADKTGNLY